MGALIGGIADHTVTVAEDVASSTSRGGCDTVIAVPIKSNWANAILLWGGNKDVLDAVL